MGNKSKNSAGEYDGIVIDSLLGTVEEETCYPPMDFAEKENEIVIRIEIPGVPENDVIVTIKNRILYVEGFKKHPGFDEFETLKICNLERGYGVFYKSIELKWSFSPSDVKSFLKNGVLTIIIPKLPDRRGAIYQIPVIKETDE